MKIRSVELFPLRLAPESDADGDVLRPLDTNEEFLIRIRLRLFASGSETALRSRLHLACARAGFYFLQQLLELLGFLIRIVVGRGPPAVSIKRQLIRPLHLDRARPQRPGLLGKISDRLARLVPLDHAVNRGNRESYDDDQNRRRD